MFAAFRLDSYVKGSEVKCSSLFQSDSEHAEKRLHFLENLFGCSFKNDSKLTNSIFLFLCVSTGRLGHSFLYFFLKILIFHVCAMYSVLGS